MPRACTICSHSNRKEIDSLIAEAVPYLRIATEYGLNDKTLGTHAKNHVKPFIAEIERQAQAAVLKRVMRYRDEVNLPLAEKSKYIENKLWDDYDTAETVAERMMVMREINKQQAEAAKLTGAYIQDKQNPTDQAYKDLLDIIKRRAEVTGRSIKEEAEICLSSPAGERLQPAIKTKLLTEVVQ